MNGPSDQELDQLCISTLRSLAADQVDKANSGHAGVPMGAAPAAYCLWQRFLRFDAGDAQWPDRDRFVMSAGHASALLYGLLHLCGVKATMSSGLAVEMTDLQTFRQAGSRCPGYPEFEWTTGVEATTGPSGQGLATSLGMAIAQAWLAATYNRPGLALFQHRVFALAGDGDIMEGLSGEAASLAGHLKLSHLCWIYDCNQISTTGTTALAFNENVAARFAAYGWQVLQVSDANDIEATTLALNTFEATHDRPTLIITYSHVGYGSAHKQDGGAVPGEPLGANDARDAKQVYGLDPLPTFFVPAGVRSHFSNQFGLRGARASAAWYERFATYRLQYPEQAAELELMQYQKLPSAWDELVPSFNPDPNGLSTSDASDQVLNVIARQVPWLMGGAAELALSPKPRLNFDFAGAFGPSSPSGRNFQFGIREHAMCALASGMALSGLRPFVASFLVFSDYARGALRLSAMMGLPVIHIWTHDSIAMGQDGPTHQPIEQLASLRAIPGMVVLRPADANEVAEAWRVTMELCDRPVSLVLSRQALPVLDRSLYAHAAGVARGAYVLADATDGKPDVLLLASGSEVALCIAAYEQLNREGIRVRVVSMPSWDLFECEDPNYREDVLPEAVKARVSVEAASPLGWDRYVGPGGTIIAMRRFGLSAPGVSVQAHFGFDVSNVIAAAREQLALHASPPPSELSL